MEGRPIRVEANPWLRALLVLLVAIAALYLAGLLWQLSTRFADVILIFFLSWLLAFVLSPIARFLTRYRTIPRVLAVIIVYLGLALLLVLAGILFLPATVEQLDQLGRSLPEYGETVPRALNNLQLWLDEHEIQVEVSRFYQPEALMQRVEGLGGLIAQNSLALAQGVFTLFVDAMLILVLSFSILLDGERISHSLLRRLPERYHDEVRYFLESIDRTFGGFLRCVIIQGVIYGLGTALVMWLAGLNFVAPVSAFAALMMIIPFLGSVLAIIPPLLLAILSGSLLKTLVVLGALLLLQQVVLNVIGPKVMSQSLGMHPLLVLLAIMVGVKVAGLWGVIFGVPVAAVLYSMALFFYDRSRLSREAA